MRCRHPPDRRRAPPDGSRIRRPSHRAGRNRPARDSRRRGPAATFRGTPAALRAASLPAACLVWGAANDENRWRLAALARQSDNLASGNLAAAATFRSTGTFLVTFQGPKPLPDAVTEYAEASHAAHLQSIHEATARYRRRLQSRGSQVDLSSVGLRIPPIPLSDIDAHIEVREPNADDRDSHDLFWSFRLAGSPLVTGLPGSGKTTGIASLVSEWAQRDHWALPLLVPLREAAHESRFRRRSLRDDILNLAVAVADPGDRALLREALDDALSNGHAALFFDGLDEAADRSLDLASDIRQLLVEVHPDTDVLLSTRDAAYADARILGFRELQLCPPRNTAAAVRAVLRAIATHNQLPHTEEWTETRAEWVDRVTTLDPQLRETPLIPILLASLAADHEENDLPTTRSRILYQVIHSVVAKRELRRDIRISGISPGQEADITLGALPILALELLRAGGSALRQDLVRPIADYLQRQWGLPSAPSRTAAYQILVFWDESGMFIATGPSRTVSARHRLFLEIGTAMQALFLSGADPDSWIADLANSDARGETLVLAAGLCPAVAHALIARSCLGSSPREDRLALEISQALSEGGTAPHLLLSRLATRLLPIIRRGGQQAWNATKAITGIAVPVASEDTILEAVDKGLPTEHALVAAAQAAVAWNWPDERRDGALEAVLHVTHLQGLQTGAGSGTRKIALWIGPRRTLMRTLEQAATLLLPRRPDLAPLVVAASRQANSRTAARLRRILLRYGHRDIVAEQSSYMWPPEWSDQLRRSSERMHRDYRDLLEMLIGLAPHVSLSLSEERRLSELASFVETLHLDYSESWLSGGRWRRIQYEWMQLIGALGGFNMSMVAAQAEVAKRESSLDSKTELSPFFDLFQFARDRQLNQWHRVGDREAGRQLLLDVLNSPWGSAWVAAKALAEHPDKESTAAAIRARLGLLPRESVGLAVQAYLSLASDKVRAIESLSCSAKDSVREAVAKLDSLVERGSPSGVAVRLVRDPVRQVRLAAIEQLGKAEPSAGIVSLLESVNSSDDVPFTCYRCGSDCDGDRESCPSCRTVTRKPSVAARESVERLRRKASG